MNYYIRKFLAVILIGILVVANITISAQEIIFLSPPSTSGVIDDLVGKKLTEKSPNQRVKNLVILKKLITENVVKKFHLSTIFKISLFVLILDQVSKSIVRRYIPEVVDTEFFTYNRHLIPSASKVLIFGEYFYLTNNKDINLARMTLFFLGGIPLMIYIFRASYFHAKYRMRELHEPLVWIKVWSISMGLMVGMLLGNGLDFLLFNGVTDWICLVALFNIADISGWIGLLFYFSIYFSPGKPAKQITPNIIEQNKARTRNNIVRSL